MKFFRVYIEITNSCGLKCDFCPPKKTKPQTMSLSLFEKILSELQGKTKEIAFHIMGDPLLNKNLKLYLDLASAYSHKVSLTTSGFYLDGVEYSTLTHEAIHQLNISLNSFNKNSSKMSLDEYLAPVFSLIDYKLKLGGEEFINLRLWNLNKNNQESAFNERVFGKIEERYGVALRKNALKRDSLRVSERVRVHFEELFVWPSLQNEITPPSSCYGLNKQLGILADGRVVPCCLDYEGKMTLGNCKDENLDTILKRSQSIALGLKTGTPSEELCKRCSYRLRFL